MATTTSTKPKISTGDIYAEVQKRILDALDKGTVPWHKPWVSSDYAPRNLQSGRPYRGINALLLALSGYDDPRWTTFNAAKKMGGKVRKGEKSTLVTLWKRIAVKDDDAPNGTKIIPILRYYRVFNVSQVDWPDGVLDAWVPASKPDDWDALDAGDAALDGFLAGDGAPSCSYGGDRAFYRPSNHTIKLPSRDVFHSAPGFYGTAFHECAHSTGHDSMLGRVKDWSGGFGSDSYAREELVAEIASAFVLATLGIDGDFDNSAAYIDGWRRAISDDPKLVVSAAGAAQRAADRILGSDPVGDGD